MKKSDHVLAFVRGEEGELFLHADAKGLSLLVAALAHLKMKAEKGVSDHEHFKTPAWGGSELTEEKGREPGELIHHLKVYAWSDDKAKVHGLIA